MLHILFLILKIIGIVLLVLLGIILLLIGTVLFVPVRYRIKAETTNGIDDLKMHAKATWILYLATATADYQNKELKWQARIGWKKFSSEMEEPEEESGDGKKWEKSDDPMDEPVKEQKETSYEESKKSAEKSATKEKVSKKQAKKKQSFIEKIKCTIKRICDKIKKIWEMKEKIVEFLTDEIHLAAFNRLKKELFTFVKRIKPDKLKGYVRFGLDEPYNTGRVLAVLSALYPFYGDNIQIYPEFEKEILEGDVFIKGRIHLISLGIAVWKLYFDKNIKTTYEDFKSLKSGM